MKVQKMNDLRPGQRVQCALCFAMIDANHAWVDLDGEPFKAYYHNGCRPDNFNVREVDNGCPVTNRD